MSPHPELFAFPAWYFTGQDGKVHYDDDREKDSPMMLDDDAQRNLGFDRRVTTFGHPAWWTGA